jgi:plasmid stabilization system protein ParE
LKPVVLTAAAKADLRSIRRDYNAKQPGLGHRFVRAVGEAIALLAENPEAMQPKEFHVRRWPVQGFPHGLMYRLHEEQAVVLAVFHPKQHPSIWQTRAL